MEEERDFCLRAVSSIAGLALLVEVGLAVHLVRVAIEADLATFLSISFGVVCIWLVMAPVQWILLGSPTNDHEARWVWHELGRVWGVHA